MTDNSILADSYLPWSIIMSFSSRSISQSARFGVAAPVVHKARSVAGASGGFRVSSAGASFKSSGIGAGLNGRENVIFQSNGKETMQNLNDRLANYLDKVRFLEESNSELESKIRLFYEKQSGASQVDFSHYYDIINDLREKIYDTTIDNTKVLLQIDNAKLAAEDFKNKYESELAVRVSVENDIAGLRKALDDLTLRRADLELDIESLKEELIFLKKSHEEEIAVANGQVGRKVNVELDSAPPVDLAKILADVRAQYEVIVEKNRQEVEAWHRCQCEALTNEVAVHDLALQTSKTEITDLKRSVQSLEIELQSLLSMKLALEGTLSETEVQYRAELHRLQELITRVEFDLQNVRSDAEHNSLEYKRLLDIKTRLEMEIATYRRLLEGEDDRFSSPIETTQVSSKHETISSTTVKKVTAVVTEIVDGKVVSSKVEKVVERS
uniref:IF rod domain-containing protein n=1 Tax=Leptobrachium leishanense TaxID=445787 RepID=A0A8C5QGD8_9ANUR